MDTAKSQILVIFGASGDLTKRKLIPALFELYKQKLLPVKFAVLGVGRTKFTDDDFRERTKSFLTGTPEKKSLIPAFLKKLFYQPLATEDCHEYQVLKDRLTVLSHQHLISKNFIFYLSTPPSLYSKIPASLASVGLNKQEDGFRRLIVEKPFGTDLSSARLLNKQLLKYFEEKQIYRIDHYLGKETVQNMLVTRFANGIFEPIWNQNYIHHVEITSAEELGVELRGGYYDNIGAMRDMVQNHLMQLLGMIAMEPPVVISADAIRNETMKVFQSLRPIKKEDVYHNVIRGQYMGSKIGNNIIPGYRQEQGVRSESRTETFFAIKAYVDNWRWSGVPFYIRTGKRLPTMVTEVVITFKQTPHHLFKEINTYCNECNQLVMRIQPDEGILLKFAMKVPGASFNVQNVGMDFHYSELSHEHLPTAYERLLLDCMQGDATLYLRGDAVERAWEYVQPILDTWQNNSDIPLYGYPAGSWGPENVDNLIENGLWRYPCKNLSKDENYCEL